MQTLLLLLQWVIFITGVASVIYAKNDNILLYPVGLVSTLLGIYVLYLAGYYGDTIINIYYSAMSIYGWYSWHQAKKSKRKEISKANVKHWKIAISIFLISVLFVFIVYQLFDYKMRLDNYIDIFTTGMFFSAMWLMAERKIEHWILWIIADTITVPLYLYRGLDILALQFVIFTVLAVFGYRFWNKKIKYAIDP